MKLLWFLKSCLGHTAQKVCYLAEYYIIVISRLCGLEVLLFKDAAKALKLQKALMNSQTFKRHFPAVSIGWKFYKLSFRSESGWRDHCLPRWTAPGHSIQFKQRIRWLTTGPSNKQCWVRLSLSETLGPKKQHSPASHQTGELQMKWYHS